MSTNFSTEDPLVKMLSVMRNLSSPKRSVSVQVDSHSVLRGLFWGESVICQPLALTIHTKKIKRGYCVPRELPRRKYRCCLFSCFFPAYGSLQEDTLSRALWNWFEPWAWPQDWSLIGQTRMSKSYLCFILMQESPSQLELKPHSHNA